MSSQHPGCSPSEDHILQRITDWVLGTEADARERQAFMMWLYGAAGAGKSAIAHTIAEKFDDGGSLLASFFFSRTDPSRNHARHLVATIAYQTALVIPEVKDSIVTAVDYDPLVFSKSLETQFWHLLFEPLRIFTSSNHPKSKSNYLVVLDGLDECVDKEERCHLLQLLMTAHRRCALPTTLRFLIASRPELDIRTLMNYQDLETGPNHLALDSEYRSNADIRLFLQEKFNEIKANHPHRARIPSEWPSQTIINKLVRTSSGQFIYASTVVKYVLSQARKPTISLDIILGLRPAQSSTPFASLDELYMHIFSTVDNLDLVLQVLSFMILVNLEDTSTLERILDLEDGDIELLFSPLGSIISFDISSMGSVLVSLLHASLADFLLDDIRSKELYINPPLKHAEYAHLCFQYISTSTRFYGFERTSSLLYHLKRALPTAQLHDDIANFSLGKFSYLWTTKSSTWTEKGFPKYFIAFILPFLSCIKALAGILALDFGSCKLTVIMARTGTDQITCMIFNRGVSTKCCVTSLTFIMDIPGSHSSWW